MKAKCCLIQPVDRDYNRHGGGRKVHLEFLDEPVSYALRTSVVPYVAISESEETDMKIVCERRCDEGVRFFKDNVCGTIRTIDGGGDKRVIETDITMVGGLQKHQTPTSDGICPCVNSAAGMGGGQTPIAIRPGYRVRKLTQKECWRLMGFTDEDFYKAQTAMNENLYGGKDRSGSQLYKQAGNFIVVDVLCAIMGELYQAMPYLFEDMVVGSFFSGIGAFEKALSTFDNASISDEQNRSIKDGDLRQIGYINDYNGDANRVYDSKTVARVLKAEAGGGGAKTGWYKVKGVIDPQGRINKKCTLRQDCPTLRAQHHGNPPEVVYGESQN